MLFYSDLIEGCVSSFIIRFSTTTTGPTKESNYGIGEGPGEPGSMGRFYYCYCCCYCSKVVRREITHQASTPA